MDPADKKILCLNVWDGCNLSCTGCHWFSDKVTFCSPRGVGEYMRFVSLLGDLERVVFTGGEPTLWPGLADAVNRMPASVRQVAIYTNGTGVSQIERIDISNVYVRLSIHAETRWDRVRRLLQTSKRRGWILKAFAFSGSLVTHLIPSWFTLPIKVKLEQQSLGWQRYHLLLGREILCQPRMLHIATDGNAYVCERGLRSKDRRFSAGFGLDWGVIQCGFRRCLVERSCISAFDQEQYIRVGGAPTGPKSAWTGFRKVVISSE